MNATIATKILESRNRPIESGAPHGACQFFVKLDKNWGAKFHQHWSPFSDALQRSRRAQQRQNKAFQVGLSVEARESFIYYDSHKNKFYAGYITARAQTLTANWNSDFYREDIEKGNRKGAGYRGKNRDFMVKWNKENRELNNKLHEFGLYSPDMKPENCGIDKKGNLIYIDFGDESMPYVED